MLISSNTFFYRQDEYEFLLSDFMSTFHSINKVSIPRNKSGVNTKYVVQKADISIIKRRCVSREL